MDDIHKRALEYIYGNIDVIDWERIISEKLTPPLPLEKHIKDDADMFWDDDDPEYGFDNVHEIMVRKLDCGYKVGDTFNVQRASQRATRTYRIVLIPATEDSDEDYDYELVNE